MPLGMDVGLGLGHIVLDGDAAPHPHICCGQTAGWIKMALGMEVGLGLGNTVLDGDLMGAPPPKKKEVHSPLIFGPYLLSPNG